MVLDQNAQLGTINQFVHAPEISWETHSPPVEESQNTTFATHRLVEEAQTVEQGLIEMEA